MKIVWLRLLNKLKLLEPTWRCSVMLHNIRLDVKKRTHTTLLHNWNHDMFQKSENRFPLPVVNIIKKRSVGNWKDTPTPNPAVARALCPKKNIYITRWTTNMEKDNSWLIDFIQWYLRILEAEPNPISGQVDWNVGRSH